jgi:uncharacterized protein (TIGR03083 family)
VLSAALATRSAGRSNVDTAEICRLVEPYRVQVAELDRLLRGLSERQWRLPAGPHRSVGDLVVHLRGNDELLAAAVGLRPSALGHRPSTAGLRRGWREQAHAVMDVIAGRDAPHGEVRLAGPTGTRGSVREALIQRGFETWIHADDVRAALRLPPRTPGGQQVSDIVNFALRLLPAAMDAAGRAHPYEAIRLILTGVGGGTRLVNLSATSPALGAVVAELSLPAERFCRLLAGRLAAPSLSVAVDGDSDAATDFLAVAATMGCD